MPVKKFTPKSAISRRKLGDKKPETGATDETVLKQRKKAVDAMRARREAKADKAEADKLAARKPGAANAESRKKAMDALSARIKARIDARKAAEAKPKKGADGTFEVTEESFKELMKEAIYEFALEHKLIPDKESGESEGAGEEDPKPSENESEAAAEGEGESESDSPENDEFAGFGESEEEDTDGEKEGEDEDILAKALSDPATKEALKKLINDAAAKKSKDAATVFTNRYESVTTVETSQSQPVRDRYN